VRKYRDEDDALPSHIARRGRALGARSDQFVDGGPAPVVDNQWVTGLDQISGHGPPHDPQANESNCLRHVSPASAEILHNLGTAAPARRYHAISRGVKKDCETSF